MTRICGKTRQIKAIRKQNHHKSIRKAGKSSRNRHQKASETIKIQYPGVQNHQNPGNRVLKAIRSCHIQESAHLRGHIQGSSRKTRKSDHISSQTGHIQESASKIISKPSKSKQNHENPLKIDSKSRKSKEIQGNPRKSGVSASPYIGISSSQGSYIHIQASESSQNHQNPGKSTLLALFLDLDALFRVLKSDSSGVLQGYDCSI